MIVVVGDVMLDVDQIGTVTRLMPDAVAPVVKIEKTIYEPGGAGRVANLLCDYGGLVVLLGFAGSDEEEKILRSRFDRKVIFESFNAGPTTRKERVIAKGGSRRESWLCRLDRESLPSPAVQDRWLNHAWHHLEESASKSSLIIVQDHGKGCVTDSLMQLLGSTGKELWVDVYLGADWRFYKESSLLFANRDECGGIVPTPDRLRSLGLKACIAKFDADGIYYVTQESCRHYPATPLPPDADRRGLGDKLLAELAVTRTLPDGTRL